MQECIKHDVPLISIDMEIPGAFTVQFGYEEAFGTIVEHVLDVHGCRRIKLFSGPADNPFSQQRVERCREIMRLHGLTLNDSDIICGEFWENPTYEAMDRFFESGEPLPEAFICCNDAMAMAVCLKLTEHGYSVPEDVIVTGFDGINLERYHKPRLTTASRDHSQINCGEFPETPGGDGGDFPRSIRAGAGGGRGQRLHGEAGGRHGDTPRGVFERSGTWFVAVGACLIGGNRAVHSWHVEHS